MRAAVASLVELPTNDGPRGSAVPDGGVATMQKKMRL
jgi:hypothetical protein